MKLNYDRLLSLYEKLKDVLNKEKPAWKSLIRKDSSGTFLRLRDISCGLKLNVALESLRLGRYCKSCENNLARNNVCPTCLKTAKGKAVSLSLRADKFSSTWDLKSGEDLEKLVKKRRRTCIKKYGVSHPSKSVEVRKKMEASFLKNLGVRNPSFSRGVLKKRVQTSLKNYGVSCPLKSEVVKQKIKRTLKSKYGVENAMQIEVSKLKCQESWSKSCVGGHPLRDPGIVAAKKITNLKKYGVEHPTQNEEVKSKGRKTSLINFGVPHPSQSQWVKDKIVSTNMRKYGVAHPKQNAEHFKKTMRFLYTQHPVTILGKTFLVQGYEPAVLKELEPRIRRLTVDPEKMPKVFYSDSKGKKRRYYPDALFQLTSNLNVLLEVKSPYTFSKPQVIHKAKASFNLCDRYRNLRYWVAVHSPKDGTSWIKSRKQFDEYLAMRNH